MSYNQAALENKLLELYPEIEANGIRLTTTFDEQRNSWVVCLQKHDHNRYAFLYRSDADACIDGNRCIYLGVLIDQYIQDLEQEMGAIPARHGSMDSDSNMEENPV